jgi:hypothetical protein
MELATALEKVKKKNLTGCFAHPGKNVFFLFSRG